MTNDEGEARECAYCLQMDSGRNVTVATPWPSDAIKAIAESSLRTGAAMEEGGYSSLTPALSRWERGKGIRPHHH